MVNTLTIPTPKKKQHHDAGSPTIRKIGGAIKFTVCGQSWYIDSGRVMNLIRNRKEKQILHMHYLNPPPKEVERGITFMRKWAKMRRYIAYKYLKEEENVLILEKKAYSRYLRKKEAKYALEMGIEPKDALIQPTEYEEGTKSETKGYKDIVAL